MWKSVREKMLWYCFVIGMAMTVYVAFWDFPEKQDAMDLGFRFLRVAGAFAIFPLDII
jgi:hypothetical protein